MRLLSWSQWVWGSLARDKPGTALSAFGVAVGVGALVFFLGMGLGVGQVLRQKVFPTDARMVEVIPPAISLGSFLGGGQLDGAVVERLAALPDVEAVFPKMNVRVPVASRYSGDFFGSHLNVGMDILVVGMEPKFLESDVAAAAFSDFGPGRPIPALASSRVLEIYNRSFAPTRNLPRLSAQMVSGFIFPLEFNRSFLTPTSSGQVLQERAQIAGVSDRVPLEGLAIPLAVARRLNRAVGSDADRFSSLSVLSKDPSGVPAILAGVKDMGLRVDDTERKTASGATLAVALTTSALGLLSLLVCLLAGVNIAHALTASVRARTQEIALLRALGASPQDIRQLILGEAFAVGLLGGIGGLSLSVCTSLGVDAAARHFLPEFPFKPESFFLFPGWVGILAVGLGLLAALGGAYFPSRRASKLDPAQAL